MFYILNAFKFSVNVLFGVLEERFGSVWEVKHVTKYICLYVFGTFMPKHTSQTPEPEFVVEVELPTRAEGEAKLEHFRVAAGATGATGNGDTDHRFKLYNCACFPDDVSSTRQTLSNYIHIYMWSITLWSIQFGRSWHLINAAFCLAAPIE